MVSPQGDPEPEPTYTVFIRVPFPRGSFVDPPQVDWNSSKDDALWDIISEVTSTEIDWNGIARRFEVPVDFLLHKVTFLTERHALRVRVQMRKATAAVKGSSGPSPSPVPSNEGVFAAEMQRTGSGGAGKGRAPSALSTRKDSPLPRTDTSRPGTPVRSTPRPQTVMRNPSSASAFAQQQRNLGGVGTGAGVGGTSGGGASVKTSSRLTGTVDTQRHRLSSLPVPEFEPDPPSPGALSTSSARTSSSESSVAQSRIIRRPPRFQNSTDNSNSFPGDDDDDEGPAFLPPRPFATAAAGEEELSNSSDGGGPSDMVNTVKDPKSAHTGTHRKLPARHGKIHYSQTSDSSTGSTPATKGSGKTRPGGPLSPRRASELAGRSPGGKAQGMSKDSDGTPSMGSSFSDLDDASVTQSAMEEVLASNMQDIAGTQSRMSTFSNVFKSRVLPRGYSSHR